MVEPHPGQRKSKEAGLIEKLVWFDINEELSGEPTLPTGMTLFLSGEVIEQYTAPTPITSRTIGSPQPDHEEDPQRNSTPFGGLGPKSSYPLTNLHWGQRDWIQWATLTDGFRQKCWRPPTDTGGKPWCQLDRGQCSLMFYMKTSVNLNPFNMLNGRQQPLGYHWHNKKPLAGGMPHLPYKGFVHRTFFLMPVNHRISGSSIRRKCWL